MTKTKLTKRNYLGKGYTFYYEDLKTGEPFGLSVTKEEHDDWCANPTLIPGIDGHKYKGYAASGEVKVDNDSWEIKPGEYCDYEDGYFVHTHNKHGRVVTAKVSKEDIKNHDIDNSKLD